MEGLTLAVTSLRLWIVLTGIGLSDMRFTTNTSTLHRTLLDDDAEPRPTPLAVPVQLRPDLLRMSLTNGQVIHLIMLSRKAVLGCPTHRFMQFWMLMMEGHMVTAEYKHSGALIAVGAPPLTLSRWFGSPFRHTNFP